MIYILAVTLSGVACFLTKDERNHCTHHSSPELTRTRSIIQQTGNHLKPPS